jgi:hypothetical protein
MSYCIVSVLFICHTSVTAQSFRSFMVSSVPCVLRAQLISLVFIWVILIYIHIYISKIVLLLNCLISIWNERYFNRFCQYEPNYRLTSLSFWRIIHSCRIGIIFLMTASQLVALDSYVISVNSGGLLVAQRVLITGHISYYVRNCGIPKLL